jgi:branched-chain amino acid transport system ATP-binding protein
MTGAILAAQGLCAGYGGVPVVHDLGLDVKEGEMVALFGANGAGKTTTLLALSGELPTLSGKVLWYDEPFAGPLHKKVRRGLGVVPEGRSVLSSLSVRDNLLLGSGGIAPAVALFPELEPLLGRRAGLLSGGEQQMVALGRALAAEPRVLLVDELSLGLAPIVVGRLLQALKHAAAQGGLAVLLVEQQARRALHVVDRWYLLKQGRIEAAGDASNAAEIERGYLGVAVDPNSKAPEKGPDEGEGLDAPADR